MVPLFNLSVEADLQLEMEAIVVELLRQQAFILGKTVSSFEEDFAKSYGTNYGIGVANGTDALVLSLRALGIGSGDEVIVPALTFYASAEAVLVVGATPVLVDVDDCLTLCPIATKAAISEKTKALMPVHLYGTPADMPELEALAKEHNLKIIEDAAQAVGASLNGKFVGQWSDMTTYSFYPTKNLGAAGDAGMVTTDNADLAQKVRELRVHAIVGDYYHNDVGYTSRLDALQAGVLAAKFKHIAKWNEKRKSIAKRYDEAFALLEAEGAKGLKLLPTRGDSVYHLYNIMVDGRADFLEKLEQKGVGARRYYPHTLADLPPLQGCERGDIGKARAAASSILCLPIYPQLSAEQQDKVIDAVTSIARV